MMFLTVGTQFPFDRLVRAVDMTFDEGLIDQEIFAQIGQTAYTPRNFKSVPSLDKETFDGYFRKASAIIGHAGIGTIAMALDNEKPLLVMPRLKKYGEVVHDHQVAIAKKFEALGHILVAYEQNELGNRIPELKNFVPRKRIANPDAVSDRIRHFLDLLAEIPNSP